MNRQFDINFPSWIHGQIYTDALQDETTIQGGSTVEYTFNHLETVGLYSSAWNNFPDKYKFISYQLNIFDSQVIHKRKTMNWKEVVGSVGGLLGFVSIFVSRFVGYFAAPQFASYVANRLYTWHEPENVTKAFFKNMKGVGNDELPVKKKEKAEHVMFL